MIYKWKILHMQKGLVNISDESTKYHYNIHRKDTNFSHEEFSTVLLVDYEYEGIEIHHQ